MVVDSVGIFVPLVFAQDVTETTDIFFNMNESGVNPDDRQDIMAELDKIKESPDFSIVVEGYTDITGEDEYNLTLSRKRAQAVRRFLIDSGIEAGKIKVQGKGKTDKFASGLDEESLRQNRRVRVIVEMAEAEPAPITETGEVDTPPETLDHIAEEAEDELEIVEEQSESMPEPLAPALTEPILPPSGLSEAIESATRKLAAGRVIFDAPREMKVGVSYVVEADVPYSFVKDLSESIDGMSVGGGGNLRMGENIGVRLKGRGFEIKPGGETNGTDEYGHSDFHRSIMKGSAEQWTWTVSPVRSGFQSLRLSIEVLVEDSRYNEMIGDYPVFQKVVSVKPNFLHKITDSYAVMAGFIIIVIAAVGWILVKKLRLS